VRDEQRAQPQLANAHLIASSGGGEVPGGGLEPLLQLAFVEAAVDQGGYEEIQHDQRQSGNSDPQTQKYLGASGKLRAQNQGDAGPGRDRRGDSHEERLGVCAHRRNLNAHVDALLEPLQNHPLDALVGEIDRARVALTQWTPETVRLVPDLQPALFSALTSTSAIVPPGTFAFNLLMWAPFVSISGVTSKDFSIDGGFAINDWRPTPFISNLKDEDGNVVSQVFQGIDADIAVLHTSEVISVSYDITLLGRIVRLGGPINQGEQQTVTSRSAALKKQ
jgi:hypothetical protein